MVRALAGFFLLLFAAGPTLAENRVALVFGADDYRFIRPLRNAVNDARTVEDALTALGFRVFPEANRDLRRMRRALEDFIEDAKGADVALVFFAGHGVEIEGENRLLPIDADVSSLEQLKNTSLPLDEVRAAVSAAAPIGLIILDACRNDPFGLSTVREDGRGAEPISPRIGHAVRPGLSRMGRAENVLFAFSAAPGETAADGNGPNSPFTTALTKYLPTDGLEIRSVLTLVQQEVYDLSRGSQLPYVESGLPATFFAATSATEMPERERLLLAMADISEAMRNEVEAIASEQDIPLAPLFASLISSDIRELDTPQRMERLHSSAASFVAVRDELRTLASSDPEVTRLRLEAEEQLSLGLYEAARSLGDQAAEIDRLAATELEGRARERFLSEAATHYLNGNAALSVGLPSGSLPYFRKAEEIFTRYHDDLPDEDRERQFSTLIALGEGLGRSSEWEQAGSRYRLALEIAEEQSAVQKSGVQWMEKLAIARRGFAFIQSMTGEREEANASYHQALDIYTGLVERNEADLNLSAELARTYLHYAYFRNSPRHIDRQDVIAASLAAANIYQRILLERPRQFAWQISLLDCYDLIATAHAPQFEETVDRDAAVAAYREAIEIALGYIEDEPEDDFWLSTIAARYDRIAVQLNMKEDHHGSFDARWQALIFTQRGARLRPGEVIWLLRLQSSWGKVGDAAIEAEKFDAALAAYESRLGVTMELASLDDEYSWYVASSRSNIGDAHIKLANYAQGLEAYYNALHLNRYLSFVDPEDEAPVNSIRFLSFKIFRAETKLGDLHASDGDTLQALEAYERAILALDNLSLQEPANSLYRDNLFSLHIKALNVHGDPQRHLAAAEEIAQQNGNSAHLLALRKAREKLVQSLRPQ